MKKAYLTTILLLCCSVAVASTINVNTGFGYYKKDGKILDKANLTIGQHELADGYEYVEVDNQVYFDAVQVDVLPLTEQEIEAKKQAELAELDRKSIRSLRAVLSAQAEGKTPDQTDLNTIKSLESQAKIIRGKK